MAVVFPAPPLLLATATRIEPHPRPGSHRRAHRRPSPHRVPVVHSGTGAGVLTSTRTRVHTCTDERLGHLDAMPRADAPRPLGRARPTGEPPECERRRSVPTATAPPAGGRAGAERERGAVSQI